MIVRKVDIKVQTVTVKSLKPEAASVTLAPGRSVQLKIKAVMSDGTTRDVTKTAAYSSSNSKYFTVGKTGLLAVKSVTRRGVTGAVVASYGGKTCKINVKVK